MKKMTLLYLGLISSPNILAETMLPNITPDMVADAAVQTFGGYDSQLVVS